MWVSNCLRILPLLLMLSATGVEASKQINTTD
jgi:hypothetical protein